MNPLSTILLAVASIVMAGAAPAPSPTAMGCRCAAETISGVLYGETSLFRVATNKTITSAYMLDMNLNYKARRGSFKGQTANGTKVHVIVDRETAYVIDDDSQSCKTGDSRDYLRFAPQRCLPAEVRYGGKFTFGTLGTSIYYVSREGAHGYTAVTDDCIAVNANLALEVNGTYLMTTFFLSKASTTIDTKALAIPTFCSMPA